MNSNLRVADAWFIARRPLPLPYPKIASAFVGIGILLIIAESIFYDFFSAFAHSGFTTRRIIGYHLFFCELWFIFVGNALLFLLIGNKRFLIPRNLIVEIRPVLLVLGAYSLWFVYGSVSGNIWALQEFREMAFTALSLPPILYFASMLTARQALEKFIVPGTLLFLAASLYQVGLPAFMLASLFIGYFLLMLLFRTYWAIIGLAIASLPFLLRFPKPMVVLFAFCVVASFLLAGYLNQASVNWIFSRFKIRITFIGLSMLATLLVAVVVIDFWSGGAIEGIIRWFFLKERLTSSGESYYGDVSGGRIAIWRAALESWTQKPIFGHGLGADIEAYSSGWVTKVQFHNYVVQCLHNTGIIGLLLIAGGWSVWLFRSIQKVNVVHDVGEKIVLGSILVYTLGIFFFGLYGHSLSYPPTTQLFWLCVGFLSANGRSVDNKVKV
jgi:O-antigen ligase